jgi:sugar phosphate isomerase/epimerase
MPDLPRVILSGFADEIAPQATAVEQFAAFAALGLQYYCLRHIDVGGGLKSPLSLTLAEIQKVRHLQDQYGLNVSSIGSALGKIKLRDVEDGTKRPYVPFDKYLGREVKKACELAHAFEAKLVHGYSFYPPKAGEPREWLAQAVNQLGQIAEACHRADLTFGLEIEPGTVGSTGQALAEIYQQVNHPGMVLVFNAAKILVQGFSSADVFQQYLAMKPGLGWMHVSDYRRPTGERTPPAAAETNKQFVPADVGDGGYEAILRDFSRLLPAVEQKLRRRGIPGVFLALEPHLKGAGAVDGFSGPDGMGVALRSLCRLLDYVRIAYHLRDFADIQAARGF